MQASAARYVTSSSNPISQSKTGFVIIPIALGISGHKSRTSKTKGRFLNESHFIKTPGIPAVKGVEVANSKS